MAKRYARINFKNAPSVDTPLDEVTLNRMDAAIDDIDTWRDGLIVDNLASGLTDKALSAKQGSVLDTKITTLNESLVPKVVKQLTINDIDVNSKTFITGFTGYITKIGKLVLVNITITTSSAGAIAMTNAFVIPEYSTALNPVIPTVSACGMNGGNGIIKPYSDTDRTRIYIALPTSVADTYYATMLYFID